MRFLSESVFLSFKTLLITLILSDNILKQTFRILTIISCSNYTSAKNVEN